MEAARAALVTLGQFVSVETAHEHIEGVAVDITEDATLVLETSGGRREIASGDIATCDHVRRTAPWVAIRNRRPRPTIDGRPR